MIAIRFAAMRFTAREIAWVESLIATSAHEAVVTKIIRRSNGKIAVERDYGDGTTQRLRARSPYRDPICIECRPLEAPPASPGPVVQPRPDPGLDASFLESLRAFQRPH